MIKIYSLSFSEFLEFHKLNNDTDSLIKFFKYGGLPYLINLKLDNQIIYDYLKNIYVQVAYLLQNEKTISREFGNLLEIKDNYPKYVISMDEVMSGSDFEGIEHVNVQEFISELR